MHGFAMALLTKNNYYKEGKVQEYSTSFLQVNSNLNHLCGTGMFEV